MISAHKFWEGTPLGTTVLLQCLLQNACYLHELDYWQLRRQSGLFIIQSHRCIEALAQRFRTSSSKVYGED